MDVPHDLVVFVVGLGVARDQSSADHFPDGVERGQLHPVVRALGDGVLGGLNLSDFLQPLLLLLRRLQPLERLLVHLLELFHRRGVHLFPLPHELAEVESDFRPVDGGVGQVGGLGDQAGHGGGGLQSGRRHLLFMVKVECGKNFQWRERIRRGRHCGPMRERTGNKVRIATREVEEHGYQ